MNDAIALLGYCLIAVFGIFLATGFCGIPLDKKTFPQLIAFTVVTLAIQGLCSWFWGLTFTRWIYPAISHIPLIVFLALGFRKPWVVAIVSVLFAYMCCQIPLLISLLSYLFSGKALYHNILYVVAVPVAYIFLHIYAVTPIKKSMSRSAKSAWGVGLLPLLYYVFDYATTVYTDTLYSGNPYIAQIMPSVVSIGYIFFALIYQTRLEEQEAAEQEGYLLSLQLRRSQAEYETLCQMQELAHRYHHDLRHHVTLLMDYAEKGAIPELKAYLQDLQQDLDAVTFKRFCGHPVIDLLLSHFDSRANDANIQLLVHADIPAVLPFKDTELCSLLSNGLENAIHACALVENTQDRSVTINLSVRQRNLLLSIQNPYQSDVKIDNGLPVSNRPGHGLGTKSIASVIHQHGGIVHFSAEDGIFLLQASLPMD